MYRVILMNTITFHEFDVTYATHDTACEVAREFSRSNYEGVIKDTTTDEILYSVANGVITDYEG